MAASAEVPPVAVSPPEVRYYLSGKDRCGWQLSSSWPPREVRKLPLWIGAGSRLSWAPPAENEELEATSLPSATGHALWSGISRYEAMIKINEQISQRWISPSPAGQGAVILFQTPPLEKAVAIAGEAVLSLRLQRANAKDPSLGASEMAQDADVFAYLCEIAPAGGNPRYVTEGQLRLSHRAERESPACVRAVDVPISDDGISKAAAAADRSEGRLPHHSFHREDMAPLPTDGHSHFSARLPLLPVCYEFAAGARIVLVLATDDAPHFMANPEAVGALPLVSHTHAEPSLLWLPAFPQQT